MHVRLAKNSVFVSYFAHRRQTKREKKTKDNTHSFFANFLQEFSWGGVLCKVSFSVVMKKEFFVSN